MTHDRESQSVQHMRGSLKTRHDREMANRRSLPVSGDVKSLPREWSRGSVTCLSGVRGHHSTAILVHNPTEDCAKPKGSNCLLLK